MSQAAEHIAAQYALAHKIKQVWSDIVINVKVFGAKGDGTTDDTSAIQTAINYAIAVGKKEVTFPVGTYKYGVLTNTDGITFIGDGVTLDGTTPVNLVSISSLAGGSSSSELVINVLDYGAKGDGVTDDTAEIQSTITEASATGGGVVYFPKGTYFFTGIITIPSNVTLMGAGYASRLKPSNTSGNTIIISGATNVVIRDLLIKGSTPAVIRITGNSVKVDIQNVDFESNTIAGEMGQCVYLGNCEFVTVNACRFKWTGYQVIQQQGTTSNNCKAINCNSDTCYNDFVELNCEYANPSRNWLIGFNTVKNVGMYDTTGARATAVKTESRFVGATMVDNLIIIGNTVEGIAGDSAVHLERPGRLTITGNSFKDCHGAFGQFIYLTPHTENLPVNTVNSQEISISDNIFEVTDTALTGDSEVFIYTGATDNWIKATIRDNTFAFWDVNFPAPPSTKYGIAISKGFVHEPWIIEGNRFMYMTTAIFLEKSIGGAAPQFNPASVVDKNTFYFCTTGVSTGTDEQLLSLEANTFDHVTTPLSLTTLPQRLGSNSFMASNVTGLSLYNSSYRPNLYSQGSTTDEWGLQKGIVNPGSAVVGSLPPDIAGVLSLHLESNSNANNNLRALYFVSNRYGSFQITQIGTSQINGTGQPTVTITGTGTNQQQLNVALSGGTADTWNTTVGFSGIARI